MHVCQLDVQNKCAKQAKPELILEDTQMATVPVRHGMTPRR